MPTEGAVVSVIGTLAWPVTVLIAAYLLRKPLAGLLGRLPGIKSMKIAGFEMEFAEAVSKPKSSLGVVSEFRRGPHVNESSARELLAEISSPTPFDEVIVDLGTGREWITSRLYLLATLLHHMRGLRTIIFIGAHEGRLGVFLGQCDAERLRWRLAGRYTWLERALLEAEAEAWASPSIKVTSDTGRIESAAAGDPEPAATILLGYIRRLQGQQPPMWPSPPLPSGPDWVELEYGVRERAEWVSSELIKQLLGGAIDSSMLIIDEFKTRTEEEKVRMLVEQKSALVAFGTPDGVFDSVLDRTKVLESIIRQQVR